jgi:hypothetical protein
MQEENAYCEKSFKLKAKKLCKECFSSSTSHGLPNIFRTNNRIIQIIWLTCFLISTGMCAFMVGRSIIDFLSYDVTTKIRVYSEFSSEFPVITICNINPFTKNASLQLLKQCYLRENGSISEDQINLNDLDSVYEPFRCTAKDPAFGDENRKKLGPDMSEMLLSCKFINRDCTAKNFSWIYLVNYGNCFRFNSGFDADGNEIAIKKVYREGDWSALEITLFIFDQPYVTAIKNLGTVIFIENRSYTQSPFQNGINLKPGSLTDLSINKKLTERLPDPFSECQSSYPDDNIFLVYRQNRYLYRERDCVYLCLQKEIIKKCKCYDVWYDNFEPQVPPCINTTQINCAEQFFDELYEKGKSELCAAMCKSECTSISFEITSSYSDFPMRKYYETLKNDLKLIKNFEMEGITRESITYELVKSRLVSFRIYFNELSYTKIKELEKIGSVDLVAGIGGKLFWNLFTFVEILFLNYIYF